MKEFDVENVNSLSNIDVTLWYDAWFDGFIFIVGTSGNFIKYINAEVSDGKLRIFTLDEFKNYELQETDKEMLLLLNFECVGETRPITFIQQINAVNNFAPEFSQPSYEIFIPTPLPEGLDITMFLTVSDDLKTGKLLLTKTIEGQKNHRNRSRSPILPTHIQIGVRQHVQS